VTAPPRGSQTGGPVAVEFLGALLRSDTESVARLLQGHPGLSSSLLVEPSGDTTRALHYFANAPGHRPHAAEIVALLVGDGADLDAPTFGAGHAETALHWAASNDDVELVDALLDAGAEIERPGSSIAGGSPLQSAVGYGQWNAQAGWSSAALDARSGMPPAWVSCSSSRKP
jgi:hypothetical protein